MNHTWSLAIEEQFYLLWPAVFRRVTGKQDRLVILLTGAIVAVWCYRGILEYWIVVRWEYVYGAFGTRADALAIGCLIAVVAHQDRIPRWLMSTTVAVAATLTIVSVTLARIGHGIELYVLPLAFAVLILHAVSYHQSPVYGWLSWRPLQVLGSWSYSVYLYHIMVNRIVPDSLGWFKLPADVFVAVLLGAASYYLVEKPVLSFRDRFFGSESRRGSSAIPSLGSGPHGPTVPRLPTQTSPDLLASEDEVETVARQV